MSKGMTIFVNKDPKILDLSFIVFCNLSTSVFCNFFKRFALFVSADILKFIAEIDGKDIIKKTAKMLPINILLIIFSRYNIYKHLFKFYRIKLQQNHQKINYQIPEKLNRILFVPAF